MSDDEIPMTPAEVLEAFTICKTQRYGYDSPKYQRLMRQISTGLLVVDVRETGIVIRAASR